MELSEVIFDLKLDGALSHRNYDKMVETWKNPNQEIPSYEYCLEIWNNVSLIRLCNQKKQERIYQVKEITNEYLRLNYDWKVSKQYTTNYWSESEFDIIKAEMQNIRDKSNLIEIEINNLASLDLVNNYIINL